MRSSREEIFVHQHNTVANEFKVDLSPAENNCRQTVRYDNLILNTFIKSQRWNLEATNALAAMKIFELKQSNVRLNRSEVNFQMMSPPKICRDGEILDNRFAVAEV